MTKGSDPNNASGDPAPAINSRLIIPGLAAGHAVLHWTVQSFVVVLPEIQQALLLSGVGVGGILAARKLATGLVKLPGGVAVDILRKYWGSLLAACLIASAVGALLMGVCPGYPLLLVGMVIVAGAHSIWHLPASASLSHHFRQRRGMALAFHGVGGGLGDAVGPMATGVLLALLTWRELLSFYAVFAFFLGVMAIWAFRNIGRTKEMGEDIVEFSQRLAVTKRLLKNPVLSGPALVYGLRAMALVALVTTFPFIWTTIWH